MKIETKFILESRKTPIVAGYQVVVIGGGPAGLSAALASSRAGAKTLLIEKYGCFGGVITTVGMETLGWYRYEGTENDSQGIGREMERVAKRMGGSTKWPYNDSQCLDAEKFKLIADHLIKEANVTPLLHTTVVDAIVKNNTILGLITESKSGRQAILAKRVIDCTGDADVAYLSGCRYTRLPLEKALGVTSVFNVSGVDKQKFLKHVEKNPATYADWDGDWSQETSGKENHLLTPYLGKEFEDLQTDDNQIINGSWSAISDEGEATNLNLVHMHGYDPTNAQDLTKAEIQGRQGVLKAIEALNKKLPGFENAKLRNFAMTLGIRDSRKIIGRYNLTAKDVAMQGRFKDSIGIFPEFIDGYNILILPTTGRYFEVPYGCMVPDVDNLLVAGRCVSGDMVAHAATRNMMCCTVTGQGAGVAAAVSLRLNQNTSKVNIKAVQQELLKQGARIGEEKKIRTKL